MKFARLGDVLIIGVLFAGLLASAAALLVGARAQQFEERPLAVRPLLHIRGLFDPAYYTSWTDYLTDINPLRQAAVVGYSRFVWFAAGGAPTNQVVFGREGWLFARDSVSAPCHDNESIKRGVENIERLGAAIEAAGKEYLFTIVPDKASIYPDKLRPGGRRLMSCVDQNEAAFQANFKGSKVSYFDSWTLMRQTRAASTELVYPREDTHWTEHGSAAFVISVAEKLEPELRHGGAVISGVQILTPDLGRLAGFHWKRDYPVVRIVREGTQSRQPETIAHDPPGREYIRNRSTSSVAPLSKRRLLVIHDSYMYIAWDQLSQFYADALYVHWSALTPERLATFVASADVILFESAERVFYERLDAYFSDTAFADAVALGPPNYSVNPWPRQNANLDPSQ